MFADDSSPIQLKQSPLVGRPDIDAFETAMERADRQKGFFVAFGYSSDALRKSTASSARPAR